MMKRTARMAIIYSLEIIAGIFTLAIFAGATLLWRLAEGPVSLEFAQGEAQRRFAEAFEGDLVSIGALEARFDPERALIIVTARDITVAEVGGEVVTRAPLIETGLALDSLLLGRAAPVEVNVVGGAISLVRRPDGAVGAGLGHPERVARTARQPGSRRDTDAILELLRNPDQSDLLGRLRRVRIENTTVRVEDELYGLSWLINDAGVEIARDDASLTAAVSGQFVTPSGYAPVNVRLEAGADLETLLFEAQASNVRPSNLAPASGPFAAIGALDAPVSFDLFINADRSDGVRAADLSLNIDAGIFRLGDVDSEFTLARLDIEYEPISGAIQIREGEIRSSILTTDLEGRVYEMRDFDDALPRRWRYDLVSSDAILDLGGVFEAPPTWSRFEASGAMDATALSVTFDRLVADIGPIVARLEGDASLSQVEDGRWLPNLRLNGPIDGNVNVATVLAFWPVELADGGRDFVSRNIVGGRGYDATFQIDMAAEDIVAGRLPNDAMELRFRFDGGQFFYVSTMTPVTEGQGSAVMVGNAMQITLDSGLIGDMRLREGFVDLPRFNPKGALARFGGRAQASAQDVMELIDMEPLAIPSQYGIDPQSISGQGDIQIEIIRPMLSNVPEEDLRFSVEADFEDVSAPTGFGEIRLNDGIVHMTANESRIVASGPVRFGPAPGHLTWTEDLTLDEDEASTVFQLEATLDSAAMDALGLPLRRFIDGEVVIQAETLGEALEFETVRVAADLTRATIEMPGEIWAKPSGADAQAEFSFVTSADGERVIDYVEAQAEGLELQGSVRLAADGRLIDARFERLFIEEFLDAGIAVTRNGSLDGPLSIDVVGRFLDVRNILPNMLDMSGGGGSPPPIGLNVIIDTVRTSDEVSYENVSLTWESNELGEESLNVSGDGPDGQFITTMAAAGSGEPRQFTMQSPDFGRLLRLFGVFENVSDGVVRISGSLPPAGSEGITRINLEADNFTLIRMPVLARILAAGSFEGLGALLNGDGISFDTLRADIALEDGLMMVAEARAAGPSLGVTTNGSVDLDGEMIALDGVLAPSYGVNSLLGNLPLVGDILVSRPGEGVIGVTFSVEGPFDGPTVFANPLSVLAPGVLRRMFEGQAAERAEQERDEIENTVVEPVEAEAEPGFIVTPVEDELDVVQTPEARNTDESPQRQPE